MWDTVTESGGPAAGRFKANKEASWWKGKFALFQRPAAWGGGERGLMSKG